ncbi:hypothetical protein Cgig2_018464 [Carnegiea gigantea]|uniref:Endonuclease/exonuclease/phosphatase domain-containing protein n=1 Tax=Carnegiea gigantea TaxID=171969 RepID=A0A9Q1K8Z6_9CARY|nr:hypothetical protein Cgig2_018464 [Carnegiea gigantea]
MLGHEEMNCRKKTQGRKEWRIKAHVDVEQNADEQSILRQEGQVNKSVEDGGLNSPNKQEDVKNFLHKHGVRFVALLETKVKLENWYTNVDYNPKVRIWVAWQGKAFQVNIKQTSGQLVHGKATHATIQKQFYVTFVYEVNTLAGRLPLWQDLKSIVHTIHEPWCVVGDFNVVLHPEKRVEGDVIQHAEVVDFAKCLEDCELHEVNTSGAFFTWTNRTIWSKIDRAMMNSL